MRLYFTLLCALLSIFAEGCGTTMRVSGPQGTEFSGHYRTTDHEQRVSGVLVPWHVTVGGNLNSFEECAFEKADRQSNLVLEVRRGWSTVARVEAPAGISGVRARKSGSEIVTEPIP
jgi:hypothetical protein